MELEVLKEIRSRAERLYNTFDFKKEETLENPVSAGNSNAFDRDMQAILAPANELKFITTEYNKVCADNIFASIQKMFNEGNRILAKNPINKDMRDLAMRESKVILDNLYIVEQNPEEFKEFVKNSDHRFDETLFFKVADKMKIKNRNKEEKIKFFQQELNGGEFLSTFVQLLGLEEESELYGIDRDIDVGVKSRERGINTARESLRACSKHWADVAISTTDRISYGLEKTAEGYSIYGMEMSFEKTNLRGLLKRDGVHIFNAPFYRINKFKRYLGVKEIQAIINTGDEYGNLIFVVGNGARAESKNRNLLLQAEFMHETLPKELKDDLTIYVDSVESPENFRAGYVDIDDIHAEFADAEPSSEFIFDMFKKTSSFESSGRPLQETKEGHIPTLATSGVVSGRYVDEVLHTKTGENIGFDNLIETKIIKREIEEEEEIKHNGEMVKEISMKKSNVIVSTAMTASGEFIELFSNETED